MSHIFISYSRKDQKYARDLAENLRVNGFDVWIDDRIDYGDRWWRTIVDAIKDSGAFVVVMSPEAEQSEWVEREILVAQKSKKPIFPILLRGAEFALLITTQFADVRNGSLPPDDFYERLQKVLKPKHESGVFVAPLPETPTTKPIVKNRRLPVQTKYLLPLIIGILFMVIVIVALFSNGDDNDTPTPTTTEIVQVDTPTDTASPTFTPIPSPTPTQTPSATFTEVNMEDVVGTFDAQATQTMAVLFNQATQTQEIAASQSAELALQGATQTATLWTATPSIDVTGSLAAVLTKRVEDAIATDIAGQTATATLWTLTPSATSSPTNTSTSTPTPTATFTPSNTPTSTLTQGEIARQSAGEGVSANEEWTPYIEVINEVEMVLIPTGCFWMGSELDDADERPAHKQCFDEPFWIDKTEVTRAKYQNCINAGVCTETPDNEYSIHNTQPINRVTWLQARDYCEWRGARLPTEKEWEYAARGPDNLIYPWGNEFVPENLAFDDNSSETANVGSYSTGSSWVGAVDMSGNVWEWVSTFYRNYPYDATDGRESNNDDIIERGLRGGGFSNASSSLRSAKRLRNFPPTYENHYWGFRCARDYE